MLRILALLAIPWLAGCTKHESAVHPDLDADGATAEVDCDDADPVRFPGNPELCNAIDDDCDGLVDERLQTAWFGDADGDGHGDVTAVAWACEPPLGAVSTGDDCDDADDAVFPEAEETCDGRDEDCDGVIDDGVGTGQTFYTDADGDGFGDPAGAIEACEAPFGTVADASDCDDTTAAVSPAADELCNDVDDDCDGEVDEEGPDPRTMYEDVDGDGLGDAQTGVATCAVIDGWVFDATDCDDSDPAVAETRTWYGDADEDGFGDPGATVESCEQPSGYVADTSDCDDTADSVNPAASETCDGVDQDCDGAIDDGATDVRVWYADTDGDGFGDAGATTTSCSPPSGYVGNADDCDDADVDTGIPLSWYPDADGDGFGAGSVAVDACDAPSDASTATGDCDDTDEGVFPGAAETCDDVDEDCDGGIDEGAVGSPTWYTDADGDGFGDPSLATVACDAPDDGVSDDSDCDDTDGDVFPGAAEGVADGIDQDCDGGEDCQTDGDGDGQGTSAVVASADLDCDDAGEAAIDGDCDDTDADVFVGAVEGTGDGVDQDCDGIETCWTDADDDGYGTATPKKSDDVDCVDLGEASVSTDCDDLSAADHPGATETVGNGDDDDCDGSETCFVDGDGDAYGTTSTVASRDTDCVDPGEAYVSTDCDDAAASDYPGAVELVANGDDEDCDGGDLCWLDADGDRYGAGTVVSLDLDCADAGEATLTTDCDDASAADYPGAVEIVANGDDENCDGSEVCYADADGDGYGTKTTKTSADADCADSGESTLTTDCDDASSGDNPAAKEIIANNDDEDCNGGEICYADADGDGYGATTTVVSLDADCADAGENTGTTDCDDGDNFVNPGVADTTCDGVDDNCDGTIDYTIPGLYFDGTSGDYVNIPVSSSSALALGTPFVIEAWVRWDGGAGGLIFNKWVSGAEDKLLSTSSTGVVSGSAYATTAYITANSGTAKLAVGDWTHVAFTWNTGTIARMFIDGIEVYEYDDVSLNAGDSTGAIRIGGQYRDSAFRAGMPGYIAQVRVSQYDEYTASFSPSPNLTTTTGRTLALWKLDEGTGTAVRDAMGVLNGTVTGATWGTVECRPD